MIATARLNATPIELTLQKLYTVRFGFAIVWAILLAASGSSINPLSATLLVIYPLFDVLAAIVDFRSSRETRPGTALYANMALSLAAAVGLAIAVTSGVSASLVVWGVWAITAGIVQLIVAVLRFRLGGQWPMILSGGISALAGTAFILMANGSDQALTPLAGYAAAGGVFFLISALRLRSASSKGA